MLIKNVNIFNQNVPIKAYDCNIYGRVDVETFLPVEKISFGATLYIYIQNKCNAKCKFCNIHCDNYCNDFDFDKLDKVLSKLKNKLLITRIGISGGEPLLDHERLDEVVKHVKCYFSDVPLTLHTNGSFLEKISQLKSLNDFNEIHISRHHFNDNVNNDIFGISVSGEKQICELNGFLKKDGILHLNCLLIKDYIDNIVKVKKYLEWSLKLGINKVAFVALTNVNKFCEDNFVSLFENENFDLSEFFINKPRKNSDFCTCGLGEYRSAEDKNKIASVFFRHTKPNTNECYHYLEFKNNKLFAGNKDIPIN